MMHFFNIRMYEILICIITAVLLSSLFVSRDHIIHVNVTYSCFFNDCLTKSYNTITIRELLLHTHYCSCGFYTFYFTIAGQGAVFTVSFHSKRQSAMNLFISPRVIVYIVCVTGVKTENDH
jgi:hypothetical protein